VRSLGGAHRHALGDEPRDARIRDVADRRLDGRSRPPSRRRDAARADPRRGPRALRSLSGAGDPARVKAILWVALLGVALRACRRSAPPAALDAGVAAPVAASNDAGVAQIVPGPRASATGPRMATVAEIHRFADLAALRKNRELAGVTRFIEEATRDVYGV